MALGSMAKGREAGKLRIEGKEYVVQDGDVIEFSFQRLTLEGRAGKPGRSFARVRGLVRCLFVGEAVSFAISFGS